MKTLRLIALGLLLLVGLFLVRGQAFAEDPKHPNPPACAEPDVDKPNLYCPGYQCWGTAACTPGYDSTCSQAASANVIYAECCLCTNLTPKQIYEGLITVSGGNVGQDFEKQAITCSTWVANNCDSCHLQIYFALQRYSGHLPIDSQNVRFAWADGQIAAGKHVTIWVKNPTKLALPVLQTSKADGSHSLTYLGRVGTQAFIHDSDCDIGGRDDNFYVIDTTTIGGTHYDYLKDYFGTGVHGYLRGVFTVDGKTNCNVPTPSLTEYGMIVLVALIFASAVYIMLKRRRASVPA